MLTDITLGQYFPGTSFLHRLDPRVKIIAVMIFIVAIFLANSLESYGIVTAFVRFDDGPFSLPHRLFIALDVYDVAHRIDRWHRTSLESL